MASSSFLSLGKFVIFKKMTFHGLLECETKIKISISKRGVFRGLLLLEKIRYITLKGMVFAEISVCINLFMVIF